MRRVAAVGVTQAAYALVVRHPAGPCAAAASRSRPPIHSGSRRALSQQARRWVSQLRHGASESPFFGSWGSTFSDGALRTRQLYCRALVYASGGGRRARDWIAGCTAMASPNQTLLTIALQYKATEADVLVFRAHMLDRLLFVEECEAAAGEGPPSPARTGGSSHVGSEADHTAAAATAPSTCEVRDAMFEQDGDLDDDARFVRRLAQQLMGGRPSTTIEPATWADPPAAEGGEDASAHAEAAEVRGPTPPSESSVATGERPTSTSAATAVAPSAAVATAAEVRAAEECVLSAAPEVRCFMYDAMTASLFHCYDDTIAVEQARERIFDLGKTHFGLTAEVLLPLWHIVEAELLVRKGKMHVLGQTWSE